MQSTLTADPLADPDWPEPEPPARRLSWLRLGFVVLVVAALAGGGTAAVVHVRDSAGTTAKSWAVPYVDVTLTPTFQFQDPDANPANDVALAFVVASPADSCAPSWGGAYTPDEAASSLELDRRISQLRAAGGNIMLSLGGLNNSELAVACTDQMRLTDAYRQLIKRYGVTTLDLDIEGTAVADTASLQRRAAALKTVQAETGVGVWLTLPVSPEGLTADGLNAVSTTLQGGVSLRGVNVMTMDFNTSAADPSAARTSATRPDMLDLTTSALEASHKQLTDLYLRLGVKLTSPEVWSRIGATPMIGQNDVDSESFTLADATGLASFAVDKGLGRVSMWSLNRDSQCKGTFTNVVVHANTCSGVSQDALAFSKVFAGLPIGSSARDSVAIPDASPSTDDPAKSPYPIWRLTALYITGYKVVWHGVVYQAKWANSGVDPAATSNTSSPTPWAVIGPVTPTDAAPSPSPTVTGVTAKWTSATIYARGDRVLFSGLPYQARWTTKGDVPSTEYPIDADDPWQPMFAVPGEPTI
ncbi:T2SS-translocated chitinase [Paractinoplanes ferrugineus]|uniref:Exported chitinase n=1 Tax=Paractinoplanes ferrugineus TaxID=113564 RepID=A0A919J020_9ACTN|nr:chitinase [Actinoplanes ferrugineus]GIE11249.1 exported chitinase [Actinoplanes ferrugineus]